MEHLFKNSLKLVVILLCISTFIGCDETTDNSFPIKLHNKRVNVQKSIEHYETRTSSMQINVDSANWNYFPLVWESAHEVVLNDMSTVVIVPLGDSAIMLDPLLDSYVVFFYDSLDSIQMHLLIFQADSTTYSDGSVPKLESYYGYLWEFYDEEDTYSIAKIENGYITDCGCSDTFSDYVTNIDSLSITTRGEILGCEDFKDGIFDKIGSWFSGAYNDFTDLTRAILTFFSGPGNSPGSQIGFDPGGLGPGIGIDLGIGGNGGGGGSPLVNLSDYFNEWELKKIIKLSNWMNSTYNLSLSSLQLFLLLGTQCMWEASDFINNNMGEPTIDDETFGPSCVTSAFIEEMGGFEIDAAPVTQSLNPCELALVIGNPGCAIVFNEHREIVREQCILIFGDNGRNDCSDAFRHALFSAINTVSCGENMAYSFGVAHECDVPINLLSEKEMDLHNNDIGIEIGLTFGVTATLQELIDAVCARLPLGDMLVLEEPLLGDSNVIDSDGCECE